jgi:DNA-directed RNA polymerase specialized sigma24 family protein
VVLTIERLLELPKEYQDESIVEEVLTYSDLSRKAESASSIFSDLFERPWHKAREAFAKHYFQYQFSKHEGLTYKELARKLNVSSETIRKMKKQRRREG